MTTYGNFIILAERLIREKGRDITLINRQIGGYDPITNTINDGFDTTRTVKAVFTEYSAKEIDGQIIQRGDKRCLIAGEVSASEIVQDGDSQYTIVNIEQVMPGEELILSKVQVRR
jgi:hypothetical protein